MWIVLGVIVVAVAAVAIVFFLTSSNDDATTAATPVPPASSSTSSSQAPGVVPSSTSSAPASSTTTMAIPGPVTVSDAAWETITGGDLGGENGQSLTDIAAIGTGYVATGRSGSGVVWTSPDAVSWTAQPVVGLEASQLLHIEPAPDGTLIGVGLSGPEGFAAWTSTDGATWTKQPPPGGVAFGGTQGISDLAAYPGGYVAVGLVDNNGDFDAAWWTSPDGIAWTASTIVEPGVQQMLGVTVSNGLMVAAGETRPDAGMWTAPLGGTFRRVTDPNLTTAVSDFDPSNTAARVFAWRIAAGGPGLVAVGADQTTAGTSQAAVWTSTDGAEWLRFGNETEYTPNMQHANFAGQGPWTVMDTITNSNGTLIAVGRTGSPSDPDLIIWESIDGFTWRQGAVGILDGPQRASNAVAHNGRLIVVGITGSLTQSPEADAAVWIATPDPNPAQIGTWREVPQFEQVDWSFASQAAVIDGRIVAVGSDGTQVDDSTQAFIWTSTAGARWSPLPAPVGAAGRAVGFVNITSFDDVVYMTGGDPEPAIWWSRDLSTWQRATTPTTSEGWINGIDQLQGHWIAYGTSVGDTPEIWVSLDGRSWDDTAAAQTIGTMGWATLTEFGSQIVLAGYDPMTDATEVWTSSDGGDWTRVPDDPAFDGLRPGSVIAFDNRLVIPGHTLKDGTWSPIVLITADLRTWESVVIDRFPEAERGVEDEGYVSRSVVIGSRLFLVGAIPRDGHDFPGLWSSADLAFWTRTEPLPVASGANDQVVNYGIVNGVVRINDRLVAVGWSRREGEAAHAAAWTSDNP